LRRKFSPTERVTKNSKHKRSATDEKPVPAGNLDQTSIFQAGL
jgi:hypothetical protein